MHITYTYFYTIKDPLKASLIPDLCMVPIMAPPPGLSTIVRLGYI